MATQTLLSPDPRVQWRWFRRLWAATASSNMADGLMLAAAPLFAASVTRDPVLVSGVVVAQNLPWLLFTLVSGAIVDRYDRRRLLVVGNALRAAATAALSVAVAVGVSHISALYAAMFVVGVAETIVDNAGLAVLPRIVDRRSIDRANGRIVATQSVVNQLVGPPLGSALFALAATVAFLSGSLAFAVAAVAAACLPRRLAPERSGQERPGPVLVEIREGLEYFWRDRLLRSVAIVAATINLVGTATGSVLVLLATSAYQLTPAEYGWLLAAGAVGGILGGLFAGRVIEHLGAGLVLFLASMLPALEYLMLALTSRAVLAGAALAVGAFAATVSQVVVSTLRQASVPDHLLGRVTSGYRIIVLGAVPLGGALGGLTASAFGLRAPFYLGAMCLAATALVFAPVLTTRAIQAATGAHAVRETS